MKNLSALLLSVLATFLAGCASTSQESFSHPLKEGDGSATQVLAVYIQVDPEKRDAFMKEMLTLLESSQKESGTLEYTLWQDLNDKNTFFLYEEYLDKAAYDAHSNSKNFKYFQTRLSEIGGVKLRAKVMDAKSTPISEKKK